MNLKFWKKDTTPAPPPAPAPTREELDDKRLAEYQAFDTVVGALPTPGTLGKRFGEAFMTGATKAAADTIAKGFTPGDAVVWTYQQEGGNPTSMIFNTLEYTLKHKWPDMTALVLPYISSQSLLETLQKAEDDKNAATAKIVHDELKRRAAAAKPQPQPLKT